MCRPSDFRGCKSAGCIVRCSSRPGIECPEGTGHYPGHR
jgi:hypothetical protein